MRTIYTDRHKLRDSKSEIHGGEVVAPFECPERAEIIRERVQAVGLGEIVAPDGFGMAPVLAVHDAGYVGFLETCVDEWRAEGFGGEAIATSWQGRSMPSPHIPRNIDGKIGYYALASETSISDGTWQAALASKDVALTATQAVLSGDRGAFGLCRPPGHHASRDQFGGYCFLNNAAIAAQYALDQGKVRVAVLDVDFHHGNGTQEIFYARNDVLFLSIHGDPFDAFPYFLGHAEEVGSGAGTGFNVNYPLPPKTPYNVWKATLLQALDRIRQAECDFLIISLGVDTFKDDPISFFKLDSGDFTDYGALLAGAGLPTVFLLEGGYAVADIGVNAVNVLQGFDAAV